MYRIYKAVELKLELEELSGTQILCQQLPASRRFCGAQTVLFLFMLTPQWLRMPMICPKPVLQNMSLRNGDYETYRKNLEHIRYVAIYHSDNMIDSNDFTKGNISNSGIRTQSTTISQTSL